MPMIDSPGESTHTKMENDTDAIINYQAQVQPSTRAHSQTIIANWQGCESALLFDHPLLF